MTADKTATPPEGWSQMDSGDWMLNRTGERLGTVVFQDAPTGRVWYSVSTAKSHGPEAGTLTECKRRIEALWR